MTGIVPFAPTGSVTVAVPPLLAFAALVGLTAAAVVVDRGGRRREAVAFRHLAAAHGMHYSRGDPLRLTPAVAAALPVPGAASVRVSHLLYRTDARGHHYVFTAAYTVGVAGPKCRVRRAGTYTESKGDPGPFPIRLAPAGLPLEQQYRTLLTPVQPTTDHPQLTIHY